MGLTGPSELIELKEVDSTSTHAAGLLAAGKPAPFVIFARRQTGGRGRRGNSWESPAGGLYLTIAMPPPAGPPELQGLLPLKAGVLIARLIQRETGIRVTLKWPNDLLFAGRKLGGLLLETTTMGGQIGEVLVGLGLNLQVAPAVRGAAYGTVSLGEIMGTTGAALDPTHWARVIAATFADAWQSLALEEVLPAYREFGIPPGELWRDTRSGDLARGGDLGADGSLVLHPIAEDGASREASVLASADHGYAWLHGGGAPSPLFVADVGNTATKVAVFAEANAAGPSRVAVVPNGEDHGALAAALDVLRDLAPVPAGYPLHVLSVNPAAAARVALAAAAAGFSYLEVRKRPVRWHAAEAEGKASATPAGYDLTSLGADRLAAIEGALARGGVAPGQGTVVVQAGTATTIDALDAGGRHVGGLILPGLNTSLAALHEVAALLPELTLRLEDRDLPLALGTATASAMREGVRFAAVGAIERVARTLESEAGESPVILLTGGYAAWLAGPTGGTVAPELVLAGIRSMVLGGTLVVEKAPGTITTDKAPR